MNYLAHLHLARGEAGLMVGALLGDWVRGLRALEDYPGPVRRGIRLHRWIDTRTDRDATVTGLRQLFPAEFRRYAGIVVDIGFDHELARRWTDFGEGSLEEFDTRTREVLSRHPELLPPGLIRFMRYADRRGLFAAYRGEDEMLFSLKGVGTRLRRANPLHRVDEIWPTLRSPLRAAFADFFPRLQSEVSAWRKRRSTSTGS